MTNVNHVNPGHNKSFDHFGDYQKRTISTHNTSDVLRPPEQQIVEQFFDPFDTSGPVPFFFDADSSLRHDDADNILLCMELESTPHSITIAFPTKTTTVNPDYPALRPYFAWLPHNIVHLIFKHTTQYAR